VGYGDKYPVTNGGRVVGSLIIIVGVAIFGTLAGYLANLFLAPSKSPAADEQQPPEMDDAHLKVGQLRALMAQQQSAMDEINLLLQADQS